MSSRSHLLAGVLSHMVTGCCPYAFMNAAESGKTWDVLRLKGLKLFHGCPSTLECYSTQMGFFSF